MFFAVSLVYERYSSEISFRAVDLLLQLTDRHFCVSLAALCQSGLDLLLEGLPHVPMVALGLREVEDLWYLVELKVA